jgi:hypothetical protein
MPRAWGPGLLLATALGIAAPNIAPAQVASPQAPSPFDGQYAGELTLAQVIDGDCTPPPLGALYPLTVSGGRVSFAYLPRFATMLTGSVAPNGSFTASARTRSGVVRITGQIRGNAVRAQIVSPSCRYDFATKN